MHKFKKILAIFCLGLVYQKKSSDCSDVQVLLVNNQTVPFCFNSSPFSLTLYMQVLITATINFAASAASCYCIN